MATLTGALIMCRDCKKLWYREHHRTVSRAEWLARKYRLAWKYQEQKARWLKERDEENLRDNWQGFHATVTAFMNSIPLARDQIEAILFWKKLNRIPDSDSMPSNI